MNYKQIHDSIIDRAQDRILESYTERHHIVPRCMGGGDDAENMVDLTAREHYVIHQLLVEMYPKVKGLVYAIHRMSTGQQNEFINNRYYAWLRDAYAKTHSAAQSGVGNSMYGHVYTEDTKAKMSKNNTGSNNPNYGKVTPPHVKEKIRKALTGQKRTAEQIESNRASQIGKIMSDQARRNMSAAQELRQGTIEKKKLVLKLHAKGNSSRQIQKDTGISRSTVARYLNMANP